MLEINLFIIIILLSKMGQQHSYLQNQAVVDSGHGLVYFQDLFSLAGPGGMKLDFQNQNSIEATAAAGANAAVMAATGHLQNQMSIGGGGMKLEFQNQNAVATAAAGANAAVMAATGNLQNQFSLSGPGGLKISVLWVMNNLTAIKATFKNNLLMIKLFIFLPHLDPFFIYT